MATHKAMCDAPSIGIVIPAHNAARFLPATLDSALAQTRADWECVVVDDGSTDETLAVAQAYAERDSRVRVIAQANAGPSAARNRGFGQLSPSIRYVTFMDADDVWQPHALQTLRDEIDQWPEAAGAHGLAEMIDADGRPHEPGYFPAFGRNRTGFDGRRIAPWDPQKPTMFETLVWVGRVYPPGVLLARREAYEQAGPWDPQYASVQDWDMCIRLSRIGPLRFVDRVILAYRRHDGNVSANLARNIRETRHIHFKTFFAPENDVRQQWIVRHGWRAWQAFKMREKAAAARGELRAGHVLRAALLAAHIGAHAFRYTRGYPTPRGL
jgi:glycosyltransferase involved in cell wall biosynthesis